jgi:hypothetical protein
LTIIPFASQTAPYIGTTAAGQPRNAALITFGGSPPVESLGSDGTITLGTNDQSPFTLPFDAIIENIYVDIGTYINFTFPSGITVFPFVQLFMAAPASNTFTAIPQTKVMPTAGFSETVPANTMRSASLREIGVSVSAGTRLLIAGQMQINGSGALTQNYYFYHTGGIALRTT